MDQALKNKINSAFKEDFVGNYVFSNGDLTSIYNEAGFVLKRVGKEWGNDLSSDDFELVFVALVNLVKEWNSDDERCYDVIYKKLLGKNFDGGKVYRQIVSVIENLNASGKIFMFNCFTRKYYATLCSHAFAPSNSMESFFDMCWEIYCNDLNQQYCKNDPTFTMIVNSLKSRFSSCKMDEDDFQIGSQVYFIRAGIRGLAIDCPVLMVKLLDMTIESINSVYNNEPLKLDKHINRLINSWWKRKESSFGLEKRKERVINGYICTDYSQIRPKYILEDGIAKLAIPSIRLIDHYDYNPYIEVKVNGTRVICEKMAMRGSGILMSTIAVEYDLSLFHCDSALDIKVEITHCDKVIYNSKDTLKRDFILFKDSKEIVASNCLPGIYFLYVRGDMQSLLQYPDDIHRTAFNTYSFEAHDGEMIQSKNKSVFFVNENRHRDLYFFTKEHKDAIYRLGDEEYKVIEGELYIDVPDDSNIKDLGVRYESAFFKLSEFEDKMVNGKRRFLISDLLSVGKPHHVTVFRFSDNGVVLSINFIKFNNIRINFDQSLYYGNGVMGNVSFTTDYCDIKGQFD